MAGGGPGERRLDQTPTWAVASVCAIIIIISIVLEKVLHRVGEWFTRRRKKALFEALEKIKGELMILGFISLLLTFGQSYIARICIPEATADTMLPCSLRKTEEAKPLEGGQTGIEGGHRRRLLWAEIISHLSSQRRILAGADSASTCSKGKVSLVSVNALHQLHIFIFFLAVFHVAFSALTMSLGRLKIRGWKEWEKETASLDYEFSNDPARFRFARETSFVRSHISFWNRVAVSFYIVSFFRQFFRSVHKADYLTMRNGFVAVHLAPGSKFDFQKYIKRSLEDDFKVVVGISPILWFSAVIFLLLNVKGWQALFWVSLVPLVVILAIGTQLQAIISKMALEIKERHVVVQGMPLVQLGDKHFWFGRPKLVLFLIHFSLFQNAFQITYFLWIWYEFGLRSCFHKNFRLIITRLALGVGVQFICSYVTLPLYALVSQMGSHMKKSIFDEQTAQALKKWHMGAKKKTEARSPRSLGQSPGATPSGSPVHPFQRYNTTGRVGLGSNISKRSYSDQNLSDFENDTPHARATVMINTEAEGAPMKEHHNQDEFSF